MTRKINEIKHYANAEDEITGDAFEIFKFPKIGNRQGEIRILRDELQSSKAVFEKLIRKNAAFKPGLKVKEDLLDKIINSFPRNRLLYSAQLGWNGAKSAFVTPNGAIYQKKPVPEPIPPLWLSNQHPVTFRTAGTLKDWQASVATLSQSSSVAMLAIGCAFAAPLLAQFGYQTFGVNIFGRSKAGKTTALLAGASVIGIGEESDLTNWGATLAAKNEAARVFKDLIYPLNEVGLIAGSKNRAYSEVREVIYRLSEGRDRLRHSQSQYAAATAGTQYHTIFVSTAEHSFDHYAALAGETRDEGEYARCLDVPVNNGTLSSIIDVNPNRLVGRRLKAQREDLVIKLREACREHHGTALKPFIEYLLKNKGSLREQIERDIASFERRARYLGMKGALAHATRNFGIVYAGGCLAMKAEILPWEKGRWQQAVLRCFNRAVKKLNLTDPLDEGRSLLKEKLKSADIKSYKEACDSAKGTCIGYYKVEDRRRRYYIHTDTFRAWFKIKPGLDKVMLDWLDQSKKLIPRLTIEGKEDRSQKDWQVHFPRLSNAGNLRAFSFWDPFPGSAR